MPSPSPTVLLGIGGSIAAYKAGDLIRLLREAGCTVVPCMTRSATKFITPLTIGVLAAQPVYVDYFDPKHNEGVDHIGLARNADCYVVAPATANLITKLAVGIADDYPSLVGIAFPRPWVIAPAMNTRMYQNPLIARHLDTLRERGARIVEPVTGLLADGEVGIGKLAPIELIRDAVLEILAAQNQMAELQVLITAGGTREPIDAVRYLGNRSSGRMGFALAEAAAWRGAEVTLITTVEPPPLPPSVRVVSLSTAREMGLALGELASQHDILVMAAAVADYTLEPREGKLHRDEEPNPVLNLVPTPDLLSDLVSRRRPGQTIVGFAAEAGDLERRATEKFTRKGCDLLVANDITAPGIGFGSRENAVSVIQRAQGSREIEIVTLPQASKAVIAHQLWDLILRERTQSGIAASPSTEGAVRYASR